MRVINLDFLDELSIRFYNLVNVWTGADELNRKGVFKVTVFNEVADAKIVNQVKGFKIPNWIGAILAATD